MGQVATSNIHQFLLIWAVLSDEQMSNGWPFSLLNDEQMSNWVGVEHQPVIYYTCRSNFHQWRFMELYFFRTFVRNMNILHPQKLTWNLEMVVSNRNLLFQGSIFRFHVCFGGCKNLERPSYGGVWPCIGFWDLQTTSFEIPADSSGRHPKFKLSWLVSLNKALLNLYFWGG